MSTDLYERNGVCLTRYWGGEEKGVCYQLTLEGKNEILFEGEQVVYKQFTAKEIRQLVNGLSNILKETDSWD